MNLFAYGTLMWPEVLEAVIGRRPEGVKAVLGGYLRLRISGACYPAIVPSEGGRVEGVVYRSLNAAEYERLDRFEGEEYERTTVMAGGIAAQAYVLSPSWLHLAEPVPWNPEDLHPEQLAAFRREYKGWPQR